MIKKRTHARIWNDEFVCRRQCNRRCTFHVSASSEGQDGEKGKTNEEKNKTPNPKII
jgi:hypothetical protein